MILTTKYQHSKLCPDGKRRNFQIYFLNEVEILKLKVPYDADYEYGWQNTTHFHDEQIIGNRLLILKTRKGKARIATYPISKEKLKKAWQKELS